MTTNEKRNLRAADFQPLPAPPLGRNWTDDDVCAFHGYWSIEQLMALRGFPKPIPYPFRGRRWRPLDHVAFRDQLVEQGQPAPPPAPDAEPRRLDGADFLRRQDLKRGRAAWSSAISRRGAN